VSRRPKLVLIHPFVPEYRRRLYDRLELECDNIGITFIVAAGTPSPKMLARQDAAGGNWAKQVPTKWLSLGSKELGYRDLRQLELCAGDYIIVEHAVKNIETYSLLLRQRRNKTRIAMWGQGKTYSTRQSKMLSSLKKNLTKRFEWFFVYTQNGLESLTGAGFPTDRITVLNNTIDTTALRLKLDEVTVAEQKQVRTKFGLFKEHTGIFIGGVDKAKGIEFLVDTATAIGKVDPLFRLLIVGEGSLSEKVRIAQASGAPIIHFGRAEGSTKAQLLSVSDLMLIPNWIGLVAVDSLVSGVPIVSTYHFSHSPERDYLIDNETSFFSEHNVFSYANLVVKLLRDPATRGEASEQCIIESHKYSIDNYVNNFVNGIQAWMKSD